MTPGEAIRMIRESACDTQRAAAKLLGIHAVQLCNVEKGKSVVSEAVRRRCEEAYGYCPVVLAVLSGDEKRLVKHRELLRQMV